MLIDGRIARVCETGFLSAALVIPRFVLNELQSIADSTDPLRQARGRRGLDVLNALRAIKTLDIRITESEVAKKEDVDAKLVFLAQSMRAKLLTTDYNLAKMAEFQGVPWLNLNKLSKSLQPELMIGESLEIELVKPGKEEGQAIGYLADGSMVVVTGGPPAHRPACRRRDHQPAADGGRKDDLCPDGQRIGPRPGWLERRRTRLVWTCPPGDFR